MIYPLIITPEAEDDVTHAYRWYEEQRAGLGRDYLACLGDALERIRHNPLSCAQSYKSVRQTLVKRFPYVVCYTFNGQRVDVLAVFHGHRDPGGWKSRTP